MHIEDLEDIFGAQTALRLYQAAEDPYCASEDSASLDGSYSTQDYFESHSDYSGMTFDSEEEEWGTLPEYGQPDVLLQPFGLQHEVDDDGKYSFKPEETHHHFISDSNNAIIANLMDYRHCDSDCSFCGMCSDRFAERLTERLLMHGALVAM